MAREVDCLVADAFLEATIAGNDIGVVIDELRSEARRHHALCNCHSDRCGNALSEWAGRGLDA